MKTKRTPWERMGSTALPLYFAMVLIYLLLPMLLVIPMSISETRYLKFPPTGFTLQWYKAFFETPSWLEATGRSLLIAFGAMVLASVAGTFASLAITSFKGPAKAMGHIFLGPQITPVIIVALGTLLIFSRLGLYGSIIGITLVHTALALPFVIMMVSAALRQTGTTLTRAARVLGARPHEAFWYVTLPTIRPAVISSAIFSFFISFDELVIALFVMGRNETLPMRIWADVRQDLTPVVAAVAALLIVATVMAVCVSELLRRGARGTEPL
jgi:ABC-type spermidine/putrescine transport system permease subunit II